MTCPAMSVHAYVDGDVPAPSGASLFEQAASE